MSDQLGRLLLHPLRHRLLLEYASGPDHPSGIAARLGEPLNVVAYHTGVLLRNDVIALVRTERRRGALTRFYRSTAATEIEDTEWDSLPEPLRLALTLGALALATDEARKAALDGGFDGHDAHLSRLPLTLDECGIEAVTRRVRSAFDELGAIAARSQMRAAATSEPHEIVLLGFRPSTVD